MIIIAFNETRGAQAIINKQFQHIHATPGKFMEYAAEYRGYAIRVGRQIFKVKLYPPSTIFPSFQNFSQKQPTKIFFGDQALLRPSKNL